MEVARTRIRIKGTKVYASAIPDLASRGVPGAAYDSASQQGRMKVWQWTGGGPNRTLLGSLSTLRSRSRDFVRRNGLADNALEMLTTQVIRYGIKPLWRTGNRDFDKQINSLFWRWCWQSDVGGRLDFYGQQALAFLSACAGGDMFVRMRTRFASDGMEVPLQLQLLESEFVPHDRNLTLDSGNEIRGGIEFDKNIKDKPVAYWMYQQHPDDNINGRVDMIPVRIPAEDVAHMGGVKRVGQVRGEPLLARALVRMRDIDLVDNALIEKMMLQAMFAGFIQPTLDQTNPFPALETTDTEGVAQGPLQPGTVQQLNPGETITWSQPPEVGNTYEVWYRNQLRQIARDSYLLYEQLSGDYSQLNDRTLRAGLNDQDGHVHRFQHHMVIPQFCIPIVQRWVRYAIMFGPLRVPDGVSMFDLLWPKMVPAPRPYINPVQDIQAQVMEVRAGFASRSEKVAERGYDAVDVDEETQADREREEALDLIYDTNGNNVASSGVFQATPEEQAAAQAANRPPQSGVKK